MLPIREIKTRTKGKASTTMDDLFHTTSLTSSTHSLTHLRSTSPHPLRRIPIINATANL